MINNLGANRFGWFLSRPEVEDNLINCLSNDNYITLVSGDGGTGKSTLVYNVISNIVQGKSDLIVDKAFWFSDADHPGELTMQKIVSDISFACGVEVVSSSYKTIDEKIANLKHLFAFDKPTIIVIDNFETILDKEVIKFVCDPPAGCKIVLTSKYACQYFLVHEIFNNRITSSINDFMIPKFLIDDLKEIIAQRQKIRGADDAFNTWVEYLKSDNMFEKTIDLLFGTLNGNIFSIITLMSQFAIQGIYTFDEIKEILDDMVDDYVPSEIYDRVIGASWELLDDVGRNVLIASVLQGNSFLSINKISQYTMLSGINNDRLVPNSELYKAIEQCHCLNMIEYSYENRQRNYYVGSLIYRFVIGKLMRGDLADFDIVINNWINEYVEMAKSIGFCYDDTSKMKFFDDPKQHAILLLVLDYCFKSHRYDDFISISENLRYYFYTRAIWETDDNCVHLKRAYAARQLGKHADEFNALVYYINIAAKYNQLDSIVKYMNRAESILLEYNVEIPEDSVFRFNHAKALVLYAEKKYNQAFKLWSSILSAMRTNNVHDIDAAKRWRLKCQLNIVSFGNKDTLNEMILQCKKFLEEAKAHKFERGIIDFTLVLVDLLIQARNIKEAIEQLNNIEQQVNVTADVLYLAKFYLYKAICYEDTTDSCALIQQSYDYYKKANINNEFDTFFKYISNKPKFFNALRTNGSQLDYIEIFFIRHLPTASNISQSFIGRDNVPCDDSYIEDHQDDLNRVKDILGDDYTCIYSSPLIRAQKTAELLLVGSSCLKTDERLTERDLGEWSGQTRDTVRSLQPEAIDEAGNLNFFITPPNGERFCDFVKRVGTFLKEINIKERSGNRIVVVTHNGIITVAKYFQMCEFSSVVAIPFQPYIEPFVLVLSDSVKKFISAVIDGKYDEFLEDEAQQYSGKGNMLSSNSGGRDEILNTQVDELRRELVFKKNKLQEFITRHEYETGYSTAIQNCKNILKELDNMITRLNSSTFNYIHKQYESKIKGLIKNNANIG